METQKPKIDLVSKLPTFQDLIDNDQVFEITRYARETGYPLSMRAAVFKGLLKYLLPRGEDQVRGNTVLEMIGQVMERFTREIKARPEAKDIVFECSFPTFVKGYDPKNPDAPAQMLRRAKDKKVKIHATLVPESMLRLKMPAILFGIKD